MIPSVGFPLNLLTFPVAAYVHVPVYAYVPVSVHVPVPDHVPVSVYDPVPVTAPDPFTVPVGAYVPVRDLFLTSVLSILIRESKISLGEALTTPLPPTYVCTQISRATVLRCINWNYLISASQ